MPVSIDDIRKLTPLCEETVPEEWLDEYGHMNVRYYMEMWGRGASKFTRQVVGMDFRESAEHGIGFWLLRQVLDYMAEVRVGEVVTVYGRMIGRTDKMMHNKYWMVNETQNKVAAASEVLVGRADLNIRRLAPFPEEDAKRLDDLIAEFDALGFDPEPSRAIELVRS